MLGKLRKDAESIIRRVGGIITTGIVIIDKSHHAGIFDPARLVLGRREDNRLRPIAIRGNLQIIVSMGDSEKIFFGFLVFACTFKPTLRPFERLSQLLDGESLAEPGKNASGGLAECTCSDQTLAPHLVTARLNRHLQGTYERTSLVYCDVAVLVDHAPEKNDG